MIRKIKKEKGELLDIYNKAIIDGEKFYEQGYSRKTLSNIPLPYSEDETEKNLAWLKGISKGYETAERFDYKVKNYE